MKLLCLIPLKLFILGNSFYQMILNKKQINNAQIYKYTYWQKRGIEKER
jgi:hypothetical protein